MNIHEFRYNSISLRTWAGKIIIYIHRYIYGQRCNTRADVPDMCGRIAKVGSHVLALGIELFCPWFKKILIFEKLERPKMKYIVQRPLI